MALNWRGSQVTRNVERAARLGVDATMQKAIQDAKSDHRGVTAARDLEGITGKVSGRRFVTGGINRKPGDPGGDLERSIRITQPAKRDSKGVFGRWGAKGIIYARRIELGFQGPDSLGRVYDQPAFPFLRPAANVEYPRLARRIRRALGRGRRA